MKILIYFYISIFLILFYINKNSETNYNIFLYIISIHFIFYLIIYFFKKTFFKKFLLINFSILFSLYLIEIFLVKKNDLKKNLNISDIIQIKKGIAKDKGFNFDDTDFFAKFDQLKDKHQLTHRFSWKALNNVEFKEAQLTTNINLYPLSGPFNSKLLGNNENGKFKILSLDRYGFKNPNSIYDKNLDAMLIGDSFFFSGSYNEKNDIAGILRSEHNINAANFGIVGTSFLSHHATLNEYGIKLKPRVIYFGYYEGNDLTELTKESTYNFLNMYLTGQNQNLIGKEKEVMSLINEYQNSRKYQNLNQKIKKKQASYNMFDFFKLQKVRYFLKISHFTQPKFNFKLLDQIFINMEKLSKKNNIKLKFIYLPSWKRYNDYFGSELLQLSKKNRVLKIASKYFEIIDFSEVLNNNPNNYFHYGLYGHYNQKGLKELAQIISDDFN